MSSIVAGRLTTMCLSSNIHCLGDPRPQNSSCFSFASACSKVLSRRPARQCYALSRVLEQRRIVPPWHQTRTREVDLEMDTICWCNSRTMRLIAMKNRRIVQRKLMQCRLLSWTNPCEGRKNDEWFLRDIAIVGMHRTLFIAQQMSLLLWAFCELMSRCHRSPNYELMRLHPSSYFQLNCYRSKYRPVTMGLRRPHNRR